MGRRVHGYSMASARDAVVTGTPVTSQEQTLSPMERGEADLKRSMTASQVKAALSSAGDPLSGVDADLLDLLAQWDTNGDGQYSVEEVLVIARHFQQKQRQMTSLKKT